MTLLKLVCLIIAHIWRHNLLFCGAAGKQQNYSHQKAPGFSLVICSLSKK